MRNRKDPIRSYIQRLITTTAGVRERASCRLLVLKLHAEAPHFNDQAGIPLETNRTHNVESCADVKCITMLMVLFPRHDT